MAARVRTYDVRNRRVEQYRRANQAMVRREQQALDQARRAEDARRDAVLLAQGLQAKLKALCLPLGIKADDIDVFRISPHVLYGDLPWDQVKRVILGRAQDALIAQWREAFAPLRDSTVSPRDFAKALRGVIRVRIEGVGLLDLDDTPLPNGQW
jgi:hypothetical protein